MSIITTHFKKELDDLSSRIGEAILRRIKNKEDIPLTKEKLKQMKVEEKLQVLQILESI